MKLHVLIGTGRAAVLHAAQSDSQAARLYSTACQSGAAECAEIPTRLHTYLVRDLVLQLYLDLDLQYW